MKHGFIKTAAATPDIKVADPVYNAGKICEEIDKAVEAGAKIIVFPELCITGYTCGDLFLQELLLKKAMDQLIMIAEHTFDKDALIFVGLPVRKDNKLYNAAAAINRGSILAFIPKANIPTYAEFCEGRYFAPGEKKPVSYVLNDGKEVREIPFGMDILFQIDSVDGLCVGCEICEDMWVPDAPGVSHVGAGATVIVNLSASNEIVGKAKYREMAVQSASVRLIAGYIYASAGEGESTQDVVFGGHNLIAENGTILAQAERFGNTIIYGDIDIHKIRHERQRMSTYPPNLESSHLVLSVSMKETETALIRGFRSTPFVPSDKTERANRCEEIIAIQTYGLKKRYQHTGCKKAVIGISGGLDSTLSLLVTGRVFDLLAYDRANIISVTMPCFGTTDRTYDNACKLALTLGTSLEEIDIKEAVTLHFRDINQNIDKHDVTYENSQARERMQVLMDIANRENALVIGTGDMSELALGWATYNGDHMSMYGVNAGVPKTLVRHLVQYYAETCGNKELEGVLLDVLDTPVSPELLPPVDGTISQKTEDIVGPYELHDFFLYYMLRCGFEPEKIYRIAKLSFAGQYENEIILKWLKVFYKRFFAQQFKRSCLPDGPKVGSVAVSPRGDLRMPSDACGRIWMEQLNELQ